MINYKSIFPILSFLVLISISILNVNTKTISTEKINNISKIEKLSKYNEEIKYQKLKTLMNKKIKLKKNKDYYILSFNSTNKIYIYKVINDINQMNISLSNIKIENTNKLLLVKLYIQREEG